MITRGTTPYHSFVLPLTTQDIQEIYITYMQNGEVVLEKTGAEVELVDINLELENSTIGDSNKGDSFASNDLAPEGEEQEQEIETYCQATVHLSQEDTLKFTFYPAAEKNIAVIQIRLVDGNGEAFASEPVRERIFGVLKEGVIGG